MTRRSPRFRRLAHTVLALYLASAIGGARAALTRTGAGQ
jgi:hypothetical protein